MPRNRTFADDPPAAPIAPIAPIPPALDLRPNAIYRPAQVIAALGLRASSLRSEWRAGRLKIRRRCGRNFLLGKDVLAWLAGGELPSPAAQHEQNGAPLN